MSTKWSTETLGKKGGTDFSALLKDESRIMLLRGKNVFGDFVYCYLKIAVPNIPKLNAAIHSEAQGTFNLSDFGEVLAAGKGEPPADVKAEIAATYPTIGAASDTASDTESGSSDPVDTPPSIEKKNWDEY